jgi:hypothetical protein
MSASGHKRTLAFVGVMSALLPRADIGSALANNEAADYRIAAFLQSMRRASGHSVHLKFSKHLIAAQPTGTKMLNSYFSAPIVL